MPVSALPAMRAAIAYSAPAVGGTFANWADYANSVFDNLLAIEFRDASLLAEATLYGSTPSIVEQPGGGLNITSNGLVCSDDTVLDTSVVPSDDTCVVVVWSALGTSNYRHIFGSAEGANVIGYRAYNTSIASRFYWATETYTVGSAPLSTGNAALLSGRAYLDGVMQGSEMTASISNVYPIYLGAANDDGGVALKFYGTIAAACIGTLKAGADADTVASELHTRMQTGAL